MKTYASRLTLFSFSSFGLFFTAMNHLLLILLGLAFLVVGEETKEDVSPT